ncbi:hypothetical protein GCM10023187_23140 [Nibrella viscosa]|uniref:Sigma 54 modulation protein / S30EA ribosomal protein n=1 Tax=Nibrella viscosa TaxID=1084524 RepID=A0ABP8KEP9_9BACT
MSKQESLDDVRLDIQAVDFELSDGLRDRILQSLAKLRRYYSGDVITAEVYMRLEESHGPNDKSYRVKYGVPGNDVFAEDSGDNWGALISSVADKLQRQLEKQFARS